MYLVDTNVVSELRKPGADRNVRDWAVSVPAASLFLSVISLLELETGVLQMERRDARQGAVLRRWLERHVLQAFGGRVLPIDTAVARQCARLRVPDRMAEGDGLIAATALVHGLTVVTRNVSDFRAADVDLVNPWEPAA